MSTLVKKQRGVRSMSSPGARSGTSTIELPGDTWERVALKAYRLWQERGCRDGCALEDWLDAEAVVLKEIDEARE